MMEGEGGVSVNARSFYITLHSLFVVVCSVRCLRDSAERVNGYAVENESGSHHRGDKGGAVDDRE
jgi:hypothetical protein